jgi:hypothetical protein
MTPNKRSVTGKRSWWLFLLLALVAYSLLQPWTGNTGDQGNTGDRRLAETGDQTSSERLSSLEEVGHGGSSFEPIGDSQGDSHGASLDDSGTSLRYGLLRELRPQEFVSPAGLKYTRGSEEGHRLAHLARHLSDMPDRPGRHGVFEGDMRQVLVWLDDAYLRSQSKAPGTSSRRQDARTVIEARFDQKLGYIGGREGRRLKNPSSKRLRLVVEGDRVITAFPF